MPACTRLPSSSAHTMPLWFTQHAPGRAWLLLLLVCFTCMPVHRGRTASLRCTSSICISTRRWASSPTSLFRRVVSVTAASPSSSRFCRHGCLKQQASAALRPGCRLASERGCEFKVVQLELRSVRCDQTVMYISKMQAVPLRVRAQSHAVRMHCSGLLGEDCTGHAHRPICLHRDRDALHVRPSTPTSAAEKLATPRYLTAASVPAADSVGLCRIGSGLIDLESEPLYLQLSSGQIMGLATGLRLVYQALDALLQLLDLLPVHCAITAALAARSTDVLVITVPCSRSGW